jgi:hypothetical protein
MPTERKYASNKERQKAYRERLKERLNNVFPIQPENTAVPLVDYEEECKVSLSKIIMSCYDEDIKHICIKKWLDTHCSKCTKHKCTFVKNYDGTCVVPTNTIM